MIAYKTYQEAKIANPESEIYRNESKTIFSCFVGDIDSNGAVVIECNPADHCMSLETFYNKNYELVIDDLYIDICDTVVTVNDEIISYVNTRCPEDIRRYVLKAAALQPDKAEKSAGKPEQPQWDGEGLPPVGVECEFGYPAGKWNKGYYHGLTRAVSKMHIVEYIDGRIETLGSLISFRKPETLEQKAAREREEAVREMSVVAYGMPVKKGEYIMSPELYRLYDDGYRKSDK